MALAAAQALRERVDRLAADPARGVRVLDRLLARDGQAPPECPELLKLDRDLQAAGVHTLTDARLLGTLARQDRRAHLLTEGLNRRLTRASVELSHALDMLEREKRLAGAIRRSRLDLAEDLISRLWRAAAITSALLEKAPDQTEAANPYRPLLTARSPGPAQLKPPEAAVLATVEHFFQQAQAAAFDVHRKRRYLDLAHEMLRSISASLSGDRQRLHQLRFRISDERHGLKVLEELARPGESLTSALRRAVHAGSGPDAWQGLLAVHRAALESNQLELAQESRRALDLMWTGLQESPVQAWEEDGPRRAARRMGDGALQQLWKANGAPTQPDPLVEAAFGLFPEKWSLFDLALTAGGFFDVDAAEEETEEAAPAPVEDPWRRVPYPTPDMSFDLASGIEQLRDFVISDPRMVLHDLASGKQLMRAYSERSHPKPSKNRRSRVRVYVCDASGSMRGVRARFRDAVLIAELNNLSLRARQHKEIWPLYTCFFNDQPQPLQRVDSDATASAAVANLFESSPARGRTDITFALEMAFQAIHDARGLDPDLARATVVLITDGEDRVDLARIDRARRPVGDVEITLNFISLGHENEDLRALTLQQKDRGRRAFYTHLSQEELSLGTEMNAGVRTLLPELPRLAISPHDPAVLAAIDALEKVALESPGVSGPPPHTRFGVYFPQSSLPSDEPAPRGAERLQDILAAVAEALALVDPRERGDEAVRLLEHLLGLYRIEVASYLKTVVTPTRELHRMMNRIRLLVGPLSDAGEEARGA